MTSAAATAATAAATLTTARTIKILRTCPMKDGAMEESEFFPPEFESSLLHTKVFVKSACLVRRNLFNEEEERKQKLHT